MLRLFFVFGQGSELILNALWSIEHELQNKTLMKGWQRFSEIHDSYKTKIMEGTMLECRSRGGGNCNDVFKTATLKGNRVRKIRVGDFVTAVGTPQVYNDPDDKTVPAPGEERLILQIEEGWIELAVPPAIWKIKKERYENGKSYEQTNGHLQDHSKKDSHGHSHKHSHKHSHEHGHSAV